MSSMCVRGNNTIHDESSSNEVVVVVVRMQCKSKSC